MSVRRQIIAALSAGGHGFATVYDVDHATRLVDAHAAEVLAAERAKREKATPAAVADAPEFFRPGHTYTQRAVSSYTQTWRFTVMAVADSPGGMRTALGFLASDKGVWTPHGEIELDGWTDVTEAGESRD